MLEYAALEARKPRLHLSTVRFWKRVEFGTWGLAFLGVFVPFFYGQVPPYGGVMWGVFFGGVIVAVLWGVALVGFLIAVLIDIRAMGVKWFASRVVMVALSVVLVRSGMGLRGWPDRLGTYVSIPSLDAMADRVASGDRAAVPAWGGIYRISSASVVRDGKIVYLASVDWVGNGRVMWMRVDRKTIEGWGIDDYLNASRDSERMSVSWEVRDPLPNSPHVWIRIRQPSGISLPY